MNNALPTWKYSANLTFFGQQRNRFTQFQPQRDLEEKLSLAAQIQGLDGVELKYPADFEDPRATRDLLDRCGLLLSAVNVDIKDAAYFRYGALSARDPQARQKAVGMLQAGMDLAAEFGASLVTTCPVVDGYDYPFQLDYNEAWNHFIDSLRSAAAHRSDVTLVIEYQPHDPNARILLANVGMVLFACAEAGMPNLGANLDTGHAFAARDNPAEAASLLARKGLLRYIHANDNTGDGGDWDMLSGAVHFWHWLEFLYTLARIGYTGWIGADIAPRHLGPVAAFQTNLDLIRAMSRLIESLGLDDIQALLREDGAFDQLYMRFIQSMLESKTKP